jgi:adenylate cyclase
MIVEQTLHAEQQVMGVEFETDLARRGQVNLSMNFSPLRDAYENRQGLAIVLDDMTEIKRREAQIAGVRRYLPTEVVDGIRSPDELKLGGTRQMISILWRYPWLSTFSEKRSERLVEILNTYMTIASDAINQYEGVIDKFMGDAVMALTTRHCAPRLITRSAQCALCCNDFGY